MRICSALQGGPSPGLTGGGSGWVGPPGVLSRCLSTTTHTAGQSVEARPLSLTHNHPQGQVLSLQKRKQAQRGYATDPRSSQHRRNWAWTQESRSCKHSGA